MGQIRKHLDLEVMKRSGYILKGDHSHKVTKHIAKINGETVFSGLYTVTNEYEEVRTQIFTATKSHRELDMALRSLNDGLQLYGNPPPAIYFTDDCCSDRNFLENVFPS